MIHEEEYFLHYLLSLFNQQRPLKVAQLIHVFHGRRTPSILYFIEIQQLFTPFELLPKLKREQLEKWFAVMQKNKWIIEKENGFVQTDFGKRMVESYFQNHYYPDNITSLQYSKARNAFWERFQLLTQVFSEKRFENMQYVPIIKHPSHQEGVRVWLSKQNEEKQKAIVMDQWIKETFSLFESLPEEVANMFAMQLSGHGRIGKTKQQTSSLINKEPYEFLLFFENALEQVILQIEKEDFFLLKEILNDILKETDYGLTDSTFLTAKYLGKGLSIDQIAKLRKLKENTIREHILEIAFIQPNFSFKSFIPEKTYDLLNKEFEKNNLLTYQEIKKSLPAVEFIHFRLVELERLRTYGTEN